MLKKQYYENRNQEMANKRFSSSVGKRPNTFNRFQNYMPEPYDRAKEKERQEKINHHAKQINGPFISNGKFNRPFTTDCELHDRRN